MSDGSVPRPPRTASSRDRARGAARPERRREAQGGAEPFVPPQDLIPRLKTFLDLALREMALSMRYEISAEAEDAGDEPRRAQDDDAAPQRASVTPAETGVLVRFSGEDEDILLAHNGELLLALEYLAHRWLHLPPAFHDAVRFECGDFRATRLEELKLSARVAAQRVRETGQPFPFNPMPSRDRRTIHLELTGAAGVRTMSEGSGDRRHIVVYPASKR